MPLLASSALPPAYASIYEEFVESYGPFRNQAAVLAHVPPALEHLSKLLMELKARQGVKPRYVELAIVVTSNSMPAVIASPITRPSSHVAGLSAAAVEALPQAGHPDLDAVDRLQ